MTDLMKRYESETGKSPLLPIRCGNCTSDYIAWLETKVEDEKRRYHQLDEMYIVVSRAEVNQRKEAEKLKDQLRWRPVNERPKKDGKYFVTLEDSLDAGTFENDTIIYTSEAKYVDGKWDIPAGLRFIRWLPIPPAPEGE